MSGVLTVVNTPLIHFGGVHAEKNGIWRCCRPRRNPRSTSSTPVVAVGSAPSQLPFFYLWVGTGAMIRLLSLGARRPSAAIGSGTIGAQKYYQQVDKIFSL